MMNLFVKLRGHHGLIWYAFLSLTLTVQCLLPPGIWGQPPRGEVRKPIVIVDVNGLSEPGRAEVLAALARTKKPSEWATVKVRADENIYSIIHRKYGFHDARYKKTADSLASLIAEANDLDSLARIRRGDELRIPVLPVRPLSSTDPMYVQMFDADEDSLAVSVISDTYYMPKHPNMLPKARGNTWVIRSDVEKHKRVVSLLKNATKKADIAPYVYVGPTYEMIKLDFADSTSDTTSMSSPLTVDEATRSLIDTLKTESVGALVLLDYFARIEAGENCSHGQKVKEVVSQALQLLGGEQFVGNVVAVDVDFVADPDRGMGEIIEYVENSYYSNVIRKILGEVAKYLADNAEEGYIPALFLSSLYSNLVGSDDVAIISSSYWTRSDGYRAIPDNYTKESDVFLLSAVLNKKNSIVEEASEEPIMSFRQAAADDYDGIFLIGAEQSQGSYYGMCSEDGDGVFCLGVGSGWGSDTTCIAPKDIGTSFATPFVGSQLLLALAFWKEAGIDLSPREIRTRFLLASDVDSAYVGKFASGGVPCMEKMLVTERALAVTNIGEVKGADSIGGHIVISVDGTGHTLNFQKGEFGFRALQVDGDHEFIFRDARGCWELVDIVDLELTVSIGGSDRVFRSLQELKSEFMEVILL